MKQYSKTAIRLVVSLLLALAVLAPAIRTEKIPLASAATAASSELTKKGAWAAYTFPYAGDSADLRISLSYSPADPYTDGAVFLDLYGPTAPPPAGPKIDSATTGDREGLKQLLVNSKIGGIYTVVVSSWDFFGRPVQFSLRATDSSGKPGPAFTFVSSSEPALAAAVSSVPVVAETAPQEPASTDAASPAPEVAAATSPAPATASPPVSGFPTFQLGRKGAWSAYNVHYHGDLSETRLIVIYDPADPFTDGGVTVDLFSPIAPPPAGAKMASAVPGYREGVQVLSLISDVGGDYTVIVSNWDPLNRPVQVTIITSDSAGNPGPPLTYVSSRP